MLLPFGIWSDTLINRALHHQLNLVFNDPVVADSVATAVLDEFNRSRWTMRIGATTALFTLSYFLAIITLRPLRKIFDTQRHFIANASHELRTPLAIMRTTSEVTLMNSNLSQREAIKSVKTNLDEIKRMTDTLQVLLSFSGYNRVDKVNFTRVNLYEVVSKAVRMIKPAVAAKKIRLIFSGQNPAVISGNLTALEELVLNLLKNAVTYTSAGGLVDIAIQRGEGNTVSLTVKDTGIGIPEEDLPYIFDPFYRGANYALVKETGHTGLGLAIVKEIANLHRAKVEVRSEQGIGTAFSVKFSGAKG